MAEKNKDKETLYGILSNRSVTVKDTERVCTDFDGETHRMICNYFYDWDINAFDNIDTLRKSMLDDSIKAPAEEQSSTVQDGSFVTIFNTISKGEVLWKGEIKLEKERRHQAYPNNPEYGQQEIFNMWVHGLQETLDPKEWASMFFSALPAKLEKADGSIVYGALEPFAETGTEGIIWSLSEYKKSGYDALNCLEDGDKLTVYKTVTDGNIHWQGKLNFTEHDIPRKLHSSEYSVTKRSFNDKSAYKLENAFIQNMPARIEPPKNNR